MKHQIARLLKRTFLFCGAAVFLAAALTSCSKKQGGFKKSDTPEFLGRYYTDKELDSLEIPEIDFPRFSTTRFMTQLNGQSVKISLNPKEFFQTKYFTIEKYGEKNYLHFFLDDTEKTTSSGPRCTYIFPNEILKDEQKVSVGFNFSLKEKSETPPPYLYLATMMVKFPKQDVEMAAVFLKGKSLYLKAHDLPRDKSVAWQDLTAQNYVKSDDFYLGEYEFGKEANLALSFEPKSKKVFATFNGKTAEFKYCDEIDFESLKSYFRLGLKITQKYSSGLFYEMFVSDIELE